MLDIAWWAPFHTGIQIAIAGEYMDNTTQHRENETMQDAIQQIISDVEFTTHAHTMSTVEREFQTYARMLRDEILGAEEQVCISEDSYDEGMLQGLKDGLNIMSALAKNLNLNLNLDL